MRRGWVMVGRGLVIVVAAAAALAGTLFVAMLIVHGLSLVFA